MHRTGAFRIPATHDIRIITMQLQDKTFTLSLRPLERQDLRFVHELNNDAKIMRYWFEEP